MLSVTRQSHLQPSLVNSVVLASNVTVATDEDQLMARANSKWESTVSTGTPYRRPRKLRIAMMTTTTPMM
jgi:hypothetical protein